MRRGPTASAILRRLGVSPLHIVKTPINTTVKSVLHIKISKTNKLNSVLTVLEEEDDGDERQQQNLGHVLTLADFSGGHFFRTR
jgi:hypothetical protein